MKRQSGPCIRGYRAGNQSDSQSPVRGRAGVVVCAGGGQVRSGAPAPAVHVHPADVVPDASRYAPLRGSKVGTAGAGATGVGAPGGASATDEREDPKAMGGDKKSLRVAYQGRGLTARPTL
jgi:hypothetical protein